MKYALIKHSDTSPDMDSDKQIYGDGLGQAPGDGLGQANILNIHLNKTLIRAGDGLGQVNKCNMHLLNTLIRPGNGLGEANIWTWTRTSKYMIYALIKQSDMTPRHGFG